MSHLISTLGSVCVSWAALCSMAAATGNVEPPRLGHSAGLLAMRPDESAPWQVLDIGQTLPERCQLRSAAGSPSVVQVPGAALHVGPESRLLLAAPQREVTLEAGSVLLSCLQGGWKLKGESLAASLEAGSAAELQAAPDAPTKMHVTQGSAHLVVKPGAQRLAVASGKMVSVGPKAKAVVTDLSPEDRKRIETWTAPAKPAQGLGQLLIQDVQSGSPVRLNIARYHVRVVLRPPVALVQVDQSFYNPYSRQEEGTFIFNLPHGASISRFAMYVTPTQLMEGELADRERAGQVYESIVRTQRDPAIFEQIGDNLFKIRVFPIFANVVSAHGVPCAGDGEGLRAMEH